MRLLETLLGSLRGCLERFPDKRRGINTTYGMGDIGMAAFSVFFMQSRSFLAHQRHFEQGHGRSNCTSLFGIAKIPSDNHMRERGAWISVARQSEIEIALVLIVAQQISSLELDSKLA